MHPEVKTENIKLGMSRPSLGMHLRNLSDKGLLIKTQSGGWKVSENYIAKKTSKKPSPADLLDSCIRKMILGD
jgi:DNA-binding transcriptional ArsR family regulator